MKKTKKTYGVYNIIEWHAIIKAGKATVKVPFSGGAMTTQGVTPATFTTANPVVQLAIERSSAFASGKIKLIKTYPTNEEVVVERNPEACQEAKEAIKEVEADASSRPQNEPGAAEAAGQNPKEEADEEEPPANDMKSRLTEMEFDNNDDAKDYLESEFGCIRSKLHNRAEIISTGKAHGVLISFV